MKNLCTLEFGEKKDVKLFNLFIYTAHTYRYDIFNKISYINNIHNGPVDTNGGDLRVQYITVIVVVTYIYYSIVHRKRRKTIFKLFFG